MSDITPEMLKVIAEGIGYKESIYKVTQIYDGVTIPPQSDYNPLTNAEQCMEIMEKLKLEMDYFNNRQEWRVNISKHKFSLGKTIPEAICKAAYKYFSEMKE